ncbi:MAG: 16S rRNA (cytosine(967)-C(5))-methyltransferase [Nostocaceae cyanobacterium]|nr:16S rRNA (cytosine(967)-C(5))-methyltransferase [Nostocaceae cyanobacterium]
MENPRQLAFIALQDVQKGAYADVALDRLLRKANLGDADRRLVTELVYGSIRRQRTLDALINQLAKKKSQSPPPRLRIILRLGLYQLRYQERIPASAAVNTTVQLAKDNGFSGLAGFVNGLLRQYIRLHEAGGHRSNDSPQTDPLQLPDNPVQHLGILHSFPDWIVQVWLEQFGLTETEKLCEWMNQSPVIDLRINPLRTSITEVETAFKASGIQFTRLPYLPQALRLLSSTGAIQNLPGFHQGWWTVQDSSAQLVSYLLDPQPGEVVIDACAAPGGKTTHIAELMSDKGKIWACDRTASRLNKLRENTVRLHLNCLEILTCDIRKITQLTNSADRVLLDAPCSGLGTLHRHADARWRQTPEKVAELSILQAELLKQTASFVKNNGVLVYATCTLHPKENEDVISAFLTQHSDWIIEPPSTDSPADAFSSPQGWIKVLPHQQQMDGFFMVRLRKTKD